MNVLPRLMLLAVTAALALTTGCMSRYKVTFANQNVTTSRGMPKHDKAEGTFRFKDTSGRKQVVPDFTVQSIEPL